MTASLAAGPNGLLSEGAHVVRDAGDVLDLIHAAGESPRADPDAALLDFCQSTYENAADLGRWDRAALEPS